EERQHDFGEQRCDHAVAAWAQLSEAVRGEPAYLDPRLARGDDVQHATGHDGAHGLRDDVLSGFVGWMALTSDQAERDSRVQVATRDVPDSVGHREHREAE